MNNAIDNKKYIFKIVLLGEGAVGKTSLLLRYIENKFNSEHLDTAGQEKFHSLGPIYYRDSQGAILKMLDDSVVIFVIGNKLDLADSRNVENKEAIDYANSVGAKYCECSAKENIGVNNLFDDLSRTILEKFKANEMAEMNLINTSARLRGSRRSLRIAEDDEVENTQRTKKKCC